MTSQEPQPSGETPETAAEKVARILAVLDANPEAKRMMIRVLRTNEFQGKRAWADWPYPIDPRGPHPADAPVEKEADDTPGIATSP